MAKAQKFPGGDVVLSLSKDEAQTLVAILDRIGGDPATTRRRYADSMNAALADAGVVPPSTIGILTNHSSIYFGED